MNPSRAFFGLLGLLFMFSAQCNEDKSAVAVTQEFFNYLLKPTINIATDAPAQQ